MISRIIFFFFVSFSSLVYSLEPLYVFETIVSLPGKNKELKKELQKIVHLSRNEKGCFSYDLYQDRENPNIFALMMAFENQEAYERHIQMPFIFQFEKDFENVLYGKVVENFYLPLSQ
jgi:quinol monooxygenase YgiN